MSRKVLALAGGVGGAKLALGLTRILPPDRLVIVVNTGDDDIFHGLHVSPDLDTMMYTLAGLANPETGWGLVGDTFGALEMLRGYGAETWFNLGDRDLATHIRRTELLRDGLSLSMVTTELCQRLGIQHQMLPMSDDPVRTMLVTDAGQLSMQQYFVQRRAEPRVKEVLYEGAEAAGLSAGFKSALDEAGLVIYCPSNPFLSLGPILAIPGARKGLKGFSGRRIAVSPIIGGEAVRGPAAKIMAELGQRVSSVGIAQQFQGLCDALLIDTLDAALSQEIAALGIGPVVAPTLMETDEDKVALARLVLALEKS